MTKTGEGIFQEIEICPFNLYQNTAGKHCAYLSGEREYPLL